MNVNNSSPLKQKEKQRVASIQVSKRSCIRYEEWNIAFLALPSLRHVTERRVRNTSHSSGTFLQGKKTLGYKKSVT